MKITKNLMRNRAGVFYKIDGDKITAQFEDTIDVFDLSPLQEGDILGEVKSELEFNPILHAERVDGELEVTLRYFYDGGGEEWLR